MCFRHYSSQELNFIPHMTTLRQYIKWLNIMISNCEHHISKGSRVPKWNPSDLESAYYFYSESAKKHLIYWHILLRKGIQLAPDYDNSFVHACSYAIFVYYDRDFEVRRLNTFFSSECFKLFLFLLLAISHTRRYSLICKIPYENLMWQPLFLEYSFIFTVSASYLCGWF